MWLENTKTSFEREKKLEPFALNYGKAFAGLILGQFIVIILAIIISI